MDDKRDLLRHTLATIAYRGGKTLRGAPPTFAAFKPAEEARTPAETLAHMGDLMDWGLSMAANAPAWNNSKPFAWEKEVARFFEALEKFDAYLASDQPLGAPAEKLFQGPVADTLWHVGQIALLRRLHDAPIKGENYFKADIVVGRVGQEQTAPRFEF